MQATVPVTEKIYQSPLKKNQKGLFRRVKTLFNREPVILRQASIKKFTDINESKTPDLTKEERLEMARMRWKKMGNFRKFLGIQAL